MKEICVPIKHLPEELQDFSIVQISDLHINTTTRVEWLQDIVAKVNSLSPDIVAFTGDFADGSLADLNPILKPITTLSSRFGNYFVTGNHEYSYSHGIISEGGVAKWKRKIEEFGFRVLLNENRILSVGKSRLLLAGVTDYYAGLTITEHQSKPKTALENAPSHDVKVLLAHQPASIHQTADLDFDLQLSGHTHGGQFFPGQLLMGLTQPAVAGLHRFQNTWLYVNRGTGYWGPPIRLGSFSEITLLKLKAIA
jgi:hypothetical protein